ncbi:MAG: hypothetical protein GY711_30450 [bacterium]|nr:hypothetical protein [bacterium]
MKRLLGLLILTPPVLAQSVVYDAGTAGNPPIAPSPQSMGWSLLDWNGQVGLNPISPDSTTGLNAWEVADNTTSGRAVYQRGVQPPTFFEYTATMRMTAGPSDTIFLEYQDGFTLTDCTFRMEFRVQGSDVIASTPGTPEYVCTGGAGTYHSYGMRFIAGDLVHQFTYDDVPLGPIAGFITSPLTDVGVRWGANSESGLGRARFHRVEFKSLPEPINQFVFCGQTIPNSTGIKSFILAFGSRMVGGPGFTLHAYGMPQNQFGYFLLSPNIQSPPGPIPPGSQGRLCMGPAAIGRFSRPGEIQFTGSTGTFELDVDTLDVPTNPPGPLSTGPMNFQVWYRDMNPGSTSNFSSPTRIIFQ